jgi:phage tail sheath protein FI
MARLAADTDQNDEVWFAFAGLLRGRLLGALDVEYSPVQGERDYMYSGGNAVNPIVSFPVDGICLFGQRTLQRASTALDRINVRRMLLYARKVIASAVRYLVFEPNDLMTWIRFVDLVSPYLRSIKARRGLEDFRVVCDETTNTPDRINNNDMVGKLFLKPTKTAEMIELEFTLLPTGATFEEFS